jgi:diguanylate cyclase (GGDEF)-like protein
MNSVVSAAEVRPFRQTRADAPVWLFTGAVAIAAAAVWALCLGGGVPGESWLPWWGLAAAFYLAEAWPVHLHFRKQAHTLSPNEVGLVLGLFFATPAALLAGQVIGAALALALHRRQKPVKLLFNVVEQALCSGIALLLFRSLAGAGDPRLWAAALVAVTAANIAGVLLVSAVIAAAERTRVVPQLGSTFLISLVGTLTIACLALVGVALVQSRPYALGLLALPAAACGFAFRGYMQQREQREYVDFLYESMRVTQGAPEMGLAVGQLLLAARRLLRAEYSEILLLTRMPEEGVRRSVSGGADDALMRAEGLTPATDDAVRHVSSTDRALLLPRRREPGPLDELLSSRGLRDAVVGALRGDEGVFGLLLVGGRVGDVTTFDENDRTLFETFASHASVLLQNGRLEESLAQVTELQEELRHQAYHDALTGLPNRALFTERVAEAVARHAADETCRAVLFLDLDRFKTVNDSWGHAAGDELLVQVAERIRDATRPHDTPARLGGDEFGVLLEDTDVEGAEHATERILDALDEPFWLSGRETHVRASIGIAVTGEHAATAEELLSNADTSMYVAKEEHRRHATYEPRLHDRLHHRQEVALELERALAGDEIVVHFQPVVSLVDGTLEAFEALARWKHPERGLVSPSEFLSVAEESGLIVEIGAQVLDQALRHARGWRNVTPAAEQLGLWVNLAPNEFANESLVEDLALALARTGFDAQRLTVEITESSVMRDEQNALKAMHRLRELGVALSIDDFGTGYSSLSRLAEFPIQLLKIPKTFVDPLAEAHAETSFIDAILRLASSLGIVTVAEGIEHPAQALRLRSLGGELGQGFLFGEPLTPDAAERFLRRGIGTTGSFDAVWVPEPRVVEHAS